MRQFILAAAMMFSGAAYPQMLSDFMPPAQVRFIKAAQEYEEKYKAAENELQKSSLWKQRTKALSAAAKPLGNEKKGKWVGIIDEMGTTGKGNAYITVKITQSISLATWNNEFSDSGVGSLIKVNSPDFEALAILKKGSVIKFSPAIDVNGQSMTEHGKMVSPNFITKFKNIEAIKDARGG